MSEQQTWVPRISDVVWAQTLINSMKDGGTWAVPMSQQVYTLHHSTNEMWLTAGPSNAIADDIFSKNVKVFGMIGWVVLDKREEKANG